MLCRSFIAFLWRNFELHRSLSSLNGLICLFASSSKSIGQEIKYAFNPSLSKLNELPVCITGQSSQEYGICWHVTIVRVLFRARVFLDRIIRNGNSSGVSTKRVAKKGACSFIAKLETFVKRINYS